MAMQESEERENEKNQQLKSKCPNKKKKTK